MRQVDGMLTKDSNAFQQWWCLILNRFNGSIHRLKTAHTEKRSKTDDTV